MGTDTYTTRVDRVGDKYVATCSRGCWKSVGHATDHGAETDAYNHRENAHPSN